MQPFSLLLPSQSKPTAVGESGYYLPMQPFLSGQDAVASLRGYYPTRRMDSRLNPHTFQTPNQLRSTTIPGSKVAGLYKRAMGAGIQPLPQPIKPTGAAGQPPTPLLKPPTLQPAAPPAGPPPDSVPPHPGMAPTHLRSPSMRMPAPPQPNVLGRAYDNFSNMGLGGLTAVAGGLGTLGGGIGSGVARATDGMGLTKDWTPSADAFTGSMARGVHSGVGTALAGATGQKPADVTAWMRQGAYPDAKPVGQMVRDDIRYLHDAGDFKLPGGGRMSGADTAGLYNALTSTGHELGALATTRVTGGGIGNILAAPQIWNSTPAAVMPAAANAAFTSHSLSDLAKQTAQGVPKFESGSTHPDKMMGFSHRDPATNQMMVALKDGRVVPENEVQNGMGQPPVQGQEPGQGQEPAGEQSALTQTPMYEQVLNFVKQAPQKAQELGQQAMNQLASVFQTQPAQLEAANVNKTGQLSPDGQKKALMALTSEGYDTDQAWQTIKSMNGWEQMGLWGGVGMSALGLLHALSGEGGIGSIIMSLLGLGVAGFTAGKAGLLDQGANDLANGLSDVAGAATGQGQQTPAIPDMLKGITGKTFDYLPDTALSAMLQQVPSVAPDYAKKLDQASGAGSWGNSMMSWLGDVSGQRQQLMQDKLGLNPQQQDRLLKLWASQRQ